MQLLDHDHKNQASAWKLIMDRMLPVGAFEREVARDGGKSAIQINITGVGTVDVNDADHSSAAVSDVSSIIEGEVVDES